MGKIDVKWVVREMNEILKQIPIGVVEENERYVALRERLRATSYVPIVDEFEKVGDKVYGRARLLPTDSARAREIYGEARQ